MRKELDVITTVLLDTKRLAYDAKLAHSKRINDPYGTFFPSPGLARKNAEKSYFDHVLILAHKTYSYPDFPLYPFSRSLTSEVEGEQSYEEMLPGWQTKEGITLNVVQLIDQLVAERLAESRETGEYRPVVVADLVYGNGQALLEAAQRWGDKVLLIGYGPAELTDFSGYDPGTEKNLTPTREHLHTLGIKLIEGNLINVRDHLTNELSPDVIMANQSLQYSDYPFWELLKKVYRTLKPGGHALIAIAPPTYRVQKHAGNDRLGDNNHRILQQEAEVLTDQLTSLRDHLSEEGYAFQIDVEAGTIAFQRINHPQTGYEPPPKVRSAFPPEYYKVTAPETPDYQVKAEGLYSYGRAYSKKPFFHIHQALVKDEDGT